MSSKTFTRFVQIKSGPTAEELIAARDSTGDTSVVFAYDFIRRTNGCNDRHVYEGSFTASIVDVTSAVNDTNAPLAVEMFTSLTPLQDELVTITYDPTQPEETDPIGIPRLPEHS
ncbi:MAG: hypothetical protein ACTJG2_01720 [Candidatus Saccharimonadales bacterium]